MILPLDNITVIALEQAVAVPFATRQLADIGARVIKIERPGVGDFARHYDKTVKGQCSHFVWLNRCKESVTLDVKHPAAADIFARLLKRADVFIQNLAPGAADRLGFDKQTMREKYPSLISCNLSGYGSDGPYRDKKAYDLLIQAETGLLSVTGTQHTPSKTGISTADIAGGMYAFSGILTALINRGRTGEGDWLEVSLFDALGEWMSFPAYFTHYGGTQPKRSGASHATISPYGPFTCAGNQQVLLGIQNEREWNRFCEQVLQQPELANDTRFVDNDARMTNTHALSKIINQLLQQLDVDDAVARLDQAGIANARMNDVESFWQHEQSTSRKRRVTVNTPMGEIEAPLPPVQFESFTAHMGDIASIGQHTVSLLSELGYSDDEIAALRKQNTI